MQCSRTNKTITVANTYFIGYIIFVKLKDFLVRFTDLDPDLDSACIHYGCIGLHSDATHCLLKALSSQVSPILHRSILTKHLQLVFGRPVPLSKSGTSQYRACCVWYVVVVHPSLMAEPAQHFLH